MIAITADEAIALMGATLETLAGEGQFLGGDPARLLVGDTRLWAELRCSLERIPNTEFLEVRCTVQMTQSYGHSLSDCNQLAQYLGRLTVIGRQVEGALAGYAIQRQHYNLGSLT